MSAGIAAILLSFTAGAILMIIIGYALKNFVKNQFFSGFGRYLFILGIAILIVVLSRVLITYYP